MQIHFCSGCIMTYDDMNGYPDVMFFLKESE